MGSKPGFKQGLNKVADNLRASATGSATSLPGQILPGTVAPKSPAEAAAAKADAAARVSAHTRVPDRYIVQFTRHLATLQMAGVHLLRCVDVLTNQPDCPKFGLVIAQVKEQVRSGKSLSVGFSKFPNIFSPLYISLVRIGEAHGALGDSLSSIADFLEKEQDIKRKVKAAMTYPAVVFFVACVITFCMVNLILPHFVEIFDGLHAELPLITRLLMEFVRICQSLWFLILAPVVLVAAIWQIRNFIHTDTGRYAWDAYKIKMPIFGEIFYKVAVVRLTRSLATLLNAGIGTITALEMSGQASGNEKMRRFMMNACDMVKAGKKVSDAFMQEDIFELLVPSMLSVGEQTGRLDIMLHKLANYYEMELDHMLTTLSSLLEPLLIVGMGIMVGFVVLAIFLPLYGLISQMGG